MGSTSEQKAAQGRVDRYKEFEKALAESKQLFEKECKRLSELSYFEKFYGFCVCPGGSQGGLNEKLLEVFFGHKPFEFYKDKPFLTPGGSLQRRTGCYTESGARLLYNRLDNGNVLCTLYPAETEDMRWGAEDFILIGIGSPSNLRRPRTVRRHLRWLGAYMSVTSLDGSPTFRQRLTVLWLRYFHRYKQDEKICFARLWASVRWVGSWVATVGLSGVLILGIERYLPDRNFAAINEERIQVTDTLKKIEGTAERILAAMNRPSRSAAKSSPVPTKPITKAHGKGTGRRTTS